jgi:photosynthetic reaction center cytochrome c subunit
MLGIRKYFLSCSILFVLLLAVIADFSGRGQAISKTVEPPGVRADSQTPPRAPVGSERCISCHAAEVEGYASSAMARSLRRPASEPQGILNLRNSKITMSSSPSGDWQRLETAGDVTNYRVEYVVGSGNHASGYLVNLGNHLFQSPVAYYRTRQSYDLAPGYENLQSPDFTRPVGEACVFCHSGAPLNIPGTLNQYRSPVFAAEAITCERCHGPVERHLSHPAAGTIVNPAKLDPAARDSVCEQCHLFGVARVPNPGKEFRDFVPGQPLEDTFTVYHNVVPQGAAPSAFKVISHVEQLALSACARNSNGRLWCGTCHDPHNNPREPVSFFRSRCLSCHGQEAFPAAHPAKDSDCVSCHMPRRDAKDGGHTAFTDHRIQRRTESESTLPTDTGIAAWREPSPELQKRNLGIANIDAGVQRRSQSMIIQGYRALTAVQNQFSSDSELFSWIGQALLLGKQSSEAEIAFDRALQLHPESSVNEGNSASARAQAGDIEGAITHLERAVALDPLYLPAAGPLVSLYRKQGKLDEATSLSAKIEAAMHPPAGTEAEQIRGVQPERRTEDVFKNVQVLKGVPAGQLIPAMQFMASSLGVDCAFCHVQGNFEKDEKKAKQTARAMMRMTFALNRENFDNRREVTCYSCHHGARKPADIPVVAVDSEPGSVTNRAEHRTLPAHLPTVAQLLDNYVVALGGASAIVRVSSRVEQGSVTSSENSGRVEIFSSASGQQASVRHLPHGDSATIFDGRNAWYALSGHPARPLQGADLDTARLDADLHFPLHIRQIFPELRVEYPENVGDFEAYVLVGIREGQPLVKFYFDQQSGLLLRVVRHADSLLGLDNAQTDYADYRNVDGVQISFRRTFSAPTSISIIQLDHVQQNVFIDASHFTPPSRARIQRTDGSPVEGKQR